jgi:PPK2 family polyphosphate:nucleotide phosphotransferase
MSRMPIEITPGKRIRLRDQDAAFTGGLPSKTEAAPLLEERLRQMRDLQERLYAQDRWAVLLIFQGMDASGKDGVIKHVMSGVNPQGCQVFSFKTPSSEELDHDFWWRVYRCLPERGRIGVFNRSHYEEVLIVRVHPALLSAQKLPSELATKRIWKERYESINGVERHLSRNGTVIRKFFLHVSKKEQRERFLARLDEPRKHWKFALPDVRERKQWNAYVRAYEDMIENTSTKHAPWYVIPADHKWYARLAVADVIVATLESLKLEYPKLSTEKNRELSRARRLLDSETKS